jgi:hypothetical protein
MGIERILSAQKNSAGQALLVLLFPFLYPRHHTDRVSHHWHV